MSDAEESGSNGPSSHFQPASPVNDEVADAMARFERTIDHQVDLLDQVDSKAQKTVQYTSALIGLIFTAVSLFASADELAFADIPTSAEIAFVIGMSSLLLSICLGIITYLSSEIEYGLAKEFGYDVADGTIQSPKYGEYVLNAYSSMVETNRDVIRVNSKRFRYTLEALFVGICYLSLAGYYFLGQFSGSLELVTGVVFTACVGIVVLYIHGEHYLVLQRN